MSCRCCKEVRTGAVYCVQTSVATPGVNHSGRTRLVTGD
jgi:hypothetical protein